MTVEVEQVELLVVAAVVEEEERERGSGEESRDGSGGDYKWMSKWR